MERKALILVPAAVVLGLASGYAWSSLTAPPPKAAKVPKSTQVAAPPSPEELPTLEDKAWTAEANDYAAANEADVSPSRASP